MLGVDLVEEGDLNSVVVVPEFEVVELEGDVGTESDFACLVSEFGVSSAMV